MSSIHMASSQEVSIEPTFVGSHRSRDEAQGGNHHESFEDTGNGTHDDVGALTRIVAPDLSGPQQHQHASFFYLALIESRCKRQAAAFINAQRGEEVQLPEDHPEVCKLAATVFAQSKRDLANVGMLPEDLVNRPIAELPSYLTSFDAAINNIAARRASDVSRPPHISFVDSQALPLGPGISQLQRPQNYSKALVRQDLRMASPLPQNGEPSLFSLLYSNDDGVVPRSYYDRDYQQLSKLGSGGFGTVFLARNGLDKQEYAIKQIAVPAEKFLGGAGAVKLQKVLNEVQSLARLQHHNIVKYHHAWLEERIRSKNLAEDEIDSEADSDSDSNPPPGSTDDVTRGVHSIQLGLERSLLKQIDRQRADSIEDEESRSYVVFETSNSAKATAEYKSTFRESGEESSEDGDDSTEEIPREHTSNEIALYKGVGKDVVLYIKMFAYPLSLEDFIWAANSKEPPPVKHCFHAIPTIRLLLAILDGTEYLHRKGFIHRDLKPPNIFLSMLEPGEPPTHQFIDISDCKECGVSEQKAHICPHIGDFGLIHDLKVVAADPAATPSKKQAALQPFPFSTAGSQQAGTKFYCPTQVPKKEPICPKLDVYSLGVITFEMVYRFGTKTERAITLDKLRDGVFPAKFEQHTLCEGIKAMLCQDRDERWSCAQVRAWLNQKLKEETEP
ncbi:uncharacterized protein RAG0_00553 [Rhynchosporium agropyri]|uniref:non-specific serine/threonine protein kinase n=1 Tax=Rhynchosporium agropyri TaxID=914238 RepID=A0A1E1JXX2_9HELO|nr:uncharacterized protein RAG0_00553 [Rhynchosporium agropyri]